MPSLESGKFLRIPLGSKVNVHWLTPSVSGGFTPLSDCLSFRASLNHYALAHVLTNGDPDALGFLIQGDLLRFVPNIDYVFAFHCLLPEK